MHIFLQQTKASRLTGWGGCDWRRGGGVPQQCADRVGQFLQHHVAVKRHPLQQADPIPVRLRQRVVHVGTKVRAVEEIRYDAILVQVVERGAQLGRVEL